MNATKKFKIFDYNLLQFLFLTYYVLLSIQFLFSIPLLIPIYLYNIFYFL